MYTESYFRLPERVRVALSFAARVQAGERKLASLKRGHESHLDAMSMNERAQYDQALSGVLAQSERES